MSQLTKMKNSSEDLDPEEAYGSHCSIHKGLAIACCCTAIALLTPVALVQLKVTKRLPDLLPGSVFNSKKIVLSRSAYKFGIPDALLGLISYSITLALLIAAQPSRPVMRGLLRGKLLLDGSIAARKSRKQFKEFGRVCSWCVGVSVATAGILYFARKARQSERLHLIA